MRHEGKPNGYFVAFLCIFIANWELLITEGKFFKIDPLR